MIETLFGSIIDIDATACSAIIECAGVGYRVAVTANTLSHLPSPSYTPAGDIIGSEVVRIYTHMAVREDGVELYGFYSSEELKMFRLLISVSGVGPKAGMSILSLLPPAKLAAAIASGDTKSISRAPGVGAKTAARITIDLKDKVAKAFPLLSSDPDISEEAPELVATAGNQTKLTDARDALSVLGYSRSEIAASMKNIDLSLPLEEIIKKALAVLMK